MNSSKQASRYSCALQMKLYASIVSLAGLLLYIKRMAKIPPFPCFTTTLIFAIPDSRIHPLRVCRSYATYYSVVIAPGKVNTRFARASFSLVRNLFMIRFIPQYSITSINLFQQHHSHQLMWECHL